MTEPKAKPEWARRAQAAIAVIERLHSELCESPAATLAEPAKEGEGDEPVECRPWERYRLLEKQRDDAIAAQHEAEARARTWQSHAVVWQQQVEETLSILGVTVHDPLGAVATRVLSERDAAIERADAAEARVNELESALAVMTQSRDRASSQSRESEKREHEMNAKYGSLAFAHAEMKDALAEMGKKLAEAKQRCDRLITFANDIESVHRAWNGQPDGAHYDSRSMHAIGNILRELELPALTPPTGEAEKDTKPRRKPCDVHCPCICHDGYGGAHHGQDCRDAVASGTDAFGIHEPAPSAKRPPPPGPPDPPCYIMRHGAQVPPYKNPITHEPAPPSVVDGCRAEGDDVHVYFDPKTGERHERVWTQAARDACDVHKHLMPDGSCTCWHERGCSLAVDHRGECVVTNSLGPEFNSRPQAEGGEPVCPACNDTHRYWSETHGRELMCTACPHPCGSCRSKPQGPYCAETPCSCECHGASREADEIDDAFGCIGPVTEEGMKRALAKGPMSGWAPGWTINRFEKWFDENYDSENSTLPDSAHVALLNQVEQQAFREGQRSAHHLLCSMTSRPVYDCPTCVRAGKVAGEIRREALEEAARLCDQTASPGAVRAVVLPIARRIRALKGAGQSDAEWDERAKQIREREV